MSFMLDLGKNTAHVFFFGWVVFLETLFSQLHLKTSEGYLFIKKDVRYFLWK